MLLIVSAPTSAAAPSCAAIWSTEPTLRILQNVSRPEKPAVVDLERVFPNLKDKIFIGVESWGHVFLQVGTVRLDGHVLSKINVIEDNRSMRHGLIFELPPLGSERLKALQERMRLRGGRQSLSCVHEILAILRQEFGWTAPEHEGTIWLSDLTTILSSQGLKNSAGRTVGVRGSATKPLEVTDFIERMRDREQTWRDQSLAEFKTNHPGLDWNGLIRGSSTSIDPIAKALDLTREDGALLARALAAKAGAGDHRRSVGSGVEAQAIARIIQEDRIESLMADAREQAALLENQAVLTPEARRRLGVLLGKIRDNAGSGSLVSRFEALKPLSEPEAGVLLAAYGQQLNPALLAGHNSIRNGNLKTLLKLARITDGLVHRAHVELNDAAYGKYALTPFEIVEAVRWSIPDEGGLKAILKESLAAAPASKKVFLEKLQQAALARKQAALLPAVEAAKAALPQDASLLPQFTTALARRDQAGHTLKENEYIERHLTPGLLRWLQNNPGLAIRVYAAHRESSLADLAREGFTEVHEFTNNRKTDFAKWLARNPTSNETVFVVQTLPGRSTSVEAVAHFLYHRGSAGRSFDPARLSVHRQTTPVRATFKMILEAHGFVPDVIVFGSVTGMSSQLAPRSQQPLGTILTEALAGKTAVVNGKKILMVSIEPRLFGDRAAELIYAVRDLRSLAPQVLFSGTAGALDSGLRIHDLVLPTQFSRRDHLDVDASPLTENQAIHRLPEDLRSHPSIKIGARHAAVDTILFEDAAWFARHSQGEDSAQVVEQELGDIARAAHDTGAPLSVVLRISDELHSGKDFSATELHGATAGGDGTVLQPSKVLIRLLDQIVSK